MNKIDKLDKELEKAREKAAEWQAKIRELEKQKQEEENSQIVQAVRSLKLTPAQLMAFLNDPKNSLTASGHTGAVDKVPDHYYERKKGNKKDAHRRHPIHLIILFKFKAVAERRQWSSAASKPRRKTRVKLCPHFWAANVPSHQICRLRSASR